MSLLPSFIEAHHQAATDVKETVVCQHANNQSQAQIVSQTQTLPGRSVVGENHRPLDSAVDRAAIGDGSATVALGIASRAIGRFTARAAFRLASAVLVVAIPLFRNPAPCSSCCWRSPGQNLDGGRSIVPQKPVRR